MNKKQTTLKERLKFFQVAVPKVKEQLAFEGENTPAPYPVRM